MSVNNVNTTTEITTITTNTTPTQNTANANDEALLSFNSNSGSSSRTKPKSEREQLMEKKAQELAQQLGDGYEVIAGNDIIYVNGPDGNKSWYYISENGNIKQKKDFTGSGNNKTTTTYEYDGNMNVVSKETKLGKDKDYRTTTINYDSDNNKESKVVTTGKAKKKTQTTEYENGKKKLKTIETNDGTITKNYKKGKIRQTSIVDKSGNETSFKYNYDENGNLSKKTKIYPDDSKTISEYSGYKKNKDGTKTRTRTVTKKDGNGKVVKTYTVEQTVDSNGKVIESIRKNKNGKVVKKVTSKRDDKGDITKQTVVKNKKNGDKVTTVRTNFKYDDDDVTYDYTRTTKKENGKTKTKKGKKTINAWDEKKNNILAGLLSKFM